MIWKYIYEKLNKGNRLYLLVVVNSRGSSPGRLGFKMAVSSDGTIFGSIGGGIMEYNLVEEARQLLDTGSQPVTFLKRQVHNHTDHEEASGMICSGEQTQLFVPIEPENITVIRAIIQADNGKQIVIDSGGIALQEPAEPINRPSFSYTSPSEWRYSEPVGPTDTVYIFGAGHISVPLSKILTLLDFRVEVYDNRNQLITYETNTYADYKAIIDYRDAHKYVKEGANSFVTIMTFEHKHDEIVLRQLIEKHLGYIGMIGSRSKVATLFRNLEQSGVDSDALKRVCSPIGLAIGGETPAEIAVSIAAQIVQYRHQSQR